MFHGLDLQSALDLKPSEESVLVLYSLTDCPPCDVLAKALGDLLRAGQCGHRIYLVKIGKEDKRALGQAVLRGKSTFPRLEFHRKGSPTRAMNGLPQFAAHAEFLQYLQEFLAESAEPRSVAKSEVAK